MLRNLACFDLFTVVLAQSALTQIDDSFGRLCGFLFEYCHHDDRLSFGLTQILLYVRYDIERHSVGGAAMAKLVRWEPAGKRVGKAAIRSATPLLHFHVAAQQPVDTGLVARALAAEPLEDIGV